MSINETGAGDPDHSLAVRRDLGAARDEPGPFDIDCVPNILVVESDGPGIAGITGNCCQRDCGHDAAGDGVRPADGNLDADVGIGQAALSRPIGVM